MELKEYLDTMAGQIRSQKARNAAMKEMEDHIKDQADVYESRGMSREDAVCEAVRQMGDPVEAGVELDRIHRPDMEWRLFGWIVAFSVLGLVIQYVCFFCFNKTPGVNGYSQWVLGDSTGNFVRQCVYTAVGLGVMAFICLWDYSVIGKHAGILGACFLAAIALSCIFGVVRKINGGHPALKCLLYVFVPLYGGILYRNRGKGYMGMAICFVWIGAVFFVGARNIGGGLGVIMDVIGVCLVMLFAAALRGWFHLQGKSGRKAALVMAAVMAVFGVLFLKYGLTGYQIRRMEAWLHPERYGEQAGYSIMTIREIVSNLAMNQSCFGILEEKGLEGILYAWGSGGEFMFLQIAVTLGLLKALGILVLLCAFFFYLFRMVFREKNQLGQMMGFGCALMLAVETVRSMLYNFGVGFGSVGGIPFFSYGKVHTLVIYVLLGFMLSIYRYRNLVWEEAVRRTPGAAAEFGRYVIRVEKRAGS